MKRLDAQGRRIWPVPVKVRVAGDEGATPRSGRLDHGGSDLAIGQAEWVVWTDELEPAPAAEPVRGAMRISRDAVLVHLPPEPELGTPRNPKRRRR